MFTYAGILTGSPQCFFVTTFLNYLYSPFDLTYHFIYIQNSEMYLGLFLEYPFSVNVFFYFLYFFCDVFQCFL